METLLFNRGGSCSGVGAVRQAVEGARDVEGLRAGERRHFAEAFQIVAVADGAWNRFAGAAGLHESLSFGDASGRNVSDKGRVWIANRSLRRIDWRFDDAMAGRFGAAVRALSAMTRVGLDVR